MATLKELKEQLRVEKNKTEALKELKDIGEERRKLKKEIKSLRFRRKFGKTVAVARALSKGSVKIGRGLAKGAKIIEKAERESQARRRAQARTGVAKRPRSFEEAINDQILK